MVTTEEETKAQKSLDGSRDQTPELWQKSPRQKKRAVVMQRQAPKMRRCSKLCSTLTCCSQKVPEDVEVSKQPYTDMNVNVPAEMQRQITSTRMLQKTKKAVRVPVS